MDTSGSEDDEHDRLDGDAAEDVADGDADLPGQPGAGDDGDLGQESLPKLAVCKHIAFMRR